MKQKSSKYILALVIVILVVGTIMLFVKGLNFELKYQNVNQIELYIGEEVKQSDIKQITEDVFGKEEVLVRIVEVYKDSISITAKNISEEQKTDLVQKINEKYGTEISVENIESQEISHVRGRDIIKPYIIPFVIVTAIVLVYMGIRYYKLKIFKIVLSSGIIIVFSQLMLLAIMAITRIKIGTFTIPLVLIVYILSIMGCTCKFENRLQEYKENEDK